MSDHESDEPLTTTHDGVTVEKRYEPDDFPVPAIAFTITSDRDEAVTVRLSDTLPEDTPTEDIGFHPNYGAEQWDVEGDAIVFTREFEPHEEFVTVYGLRGKDASDPERFLTEPELTSVDALEGDSGDEVGSGLDDVPTAESSADEDAGADVDEPAATDAQAESGAAAAGDDDPEGSEDPEATADEVDPSLDIDLPGPDDAVADDPAETEPDDDAGAAGHSGTSAAVGDDAGAAGDSGASASAPAATGDGTLAATLAEEISEGRVDDADLAELRDALGVTAEDSTNARIEHLQSSVADLEAYTDAIEEFLDEEGDAQAVLRDVRENYQSTVDRFDDLAADIDDVQADLATDTQDLREDLAMAEDDLSTDIEDLRSDLAAAEDDLAADVGDLREDLADVEAEVTEATEERIEALERDLEALEAELADVAEMRDRLVDALGGLAGAGGGDETRTTGDASVAGDAAEDEPGRDDDAGGTGLDQID